MQSIATTSDRINLLVLRLKRAVKRYELHLGSLTGGTVANAIPREAAAVVLLPDNQVEAFAKLSRHMRPQSEQDSLPINPATSPPAGLLQCSWNVTGLSPSRPGFLTMLEQHGWDLIPGPLRHAIRNTVRLEVCVRGKGGDSC